MSRFAEFLSDIKWAFFAGFAVFILSMGSIMFVSMNATSSTAARVRFYQFFIHESTPEYEALPEGEFVKSLRTLLNNQEEALARMQAYQVLNGNATIRSFDRTFAAMSVEERNILVQGNISEVNVLIEKEQKLHKEYEDNLRGFRFSWMVLSFVVWQVASVISFFRFWWSESFVMAYFPHAQWWFWLYSLLALPWSLPLWCAIVLSRRWYKRVAARSRAQNPAQHEEYEKRSKSAIAQHAQTRKEWETLFPPSLIERERRKLEMALPGLREQADRLADDLAKVQQEYFTAQAQIDALNGVPDAGDSARTDALKKTWSDEFDSLLQIPHIRAIEIREGTVRIYTDTFRSSSGGVGPFEIKIDLVRNTFEARIGHDGVLRNSTGLGSNSTFCFGNACKNIASLVREYKLSEAVSLMVHSLQTNA